MIGPMEISEVIARVKWARDVYTTGDNNKALDMAVSALEKQVPKKPIRKIDIYDTTYAYRCPVCKTYFGNQGKRSVILFPTPRYCNCGQRLDWEPFLKK